MKPCLRSALLMSLYGYSKSRVYLARRFFLHTRQYVRIGVQSDSDLGMPKALAHNLWMDAVAQELGRVGVTEIVKPDAGQVGSADKTGKGRGETVGRPRAAIRARADDVNILIGWAKLEALLGLFGLVSPQ